MKDMPNGSTVEDDTDRNLLSMFDKYLNGQLKHFDDEFDGDDESILDGGKECIRDGGKECMNESVNEFTSNYFQSARTQRLCKSRRSSVFGNLLNSSRSKSALEVVQLLRHYYEEERNQTLLSSFVESKIELPIDFDALEEDEAVTEVFRLKDEVEEKKVTTPKQIVQHHKQDLERLVKLLHDSKEEIMNSSQPSEPEVYNQNKVQELTVQILNRIKAIKELQSTARERLQDLETLQSIGKWTRTP